MTARNGKRLAPFAVLTAGIALLVAAGGADAQPPAKGCGCMGGMMGGMMADMRSDMMLFHYLLAHREDVRRQVKKLSDGVETLTESDVPEVAGKIQEHVASMYKRLKEGRPIHMMMRDPLFAEIFRNAAKIKMVVEKTPKGVRVKETSDDPQVVALIQAHAEVVNGFIANGHAEMHRNHPVPAPKVRTMKDAATE